MQSTPSPRHAGLPPPLALDLKVADRTVGWIAHDRVGLRGFADEQEAAHAAWAAYRTVARRLARTHGTRPVPIDTEPLALQKSGDEELIVASGRPIATLVRPAPDSPSGPDTFGFEIRVPPPTDEVRMRAMAYLIYRTLRKSGMRWALWRPAPAAVTEVATAEHAAVEHADARTVNTNRRSARGASERRRRPAWTLSTFLRRQAGQLG